MFKMILNNILHVKKMSVKEFASKVNLNISLVSRFLSGDRIPNYNHLLNIIEKLNLTPEILFPVKYNIQLNNNYSFIRLTRNGVLYGVYLDNNNQFGIFRYHCDTNQTIVDLSSAFQLNEIMKAVKVIIVEIGSMAVENIYGHFQIQSGQAYVINGNETKIIINNGTRIIVIIHGISIDEFTSIINKITSTI